MGRPSLAADVLVEGNRIQKIAKKPGQISGAGFGADVGVIDGNGLSSCPA